MLDVMIITCNESANLPHCLAALRGWVDNVFIVDSGSTDDTTQIAGSYGAAVVRHDWEGYARQKNWGLKNLPFKSDWLLLLDADEVVTPQVREHIERIVRQPADQVRENGFFINRLTYFLGKPIYHCGYFPSWNLRLFKCGKGRFEDRAVHEHLVIDKPVGFIREPMLHHDRRGLEHYIAKHNRYSTLEAQAILHELNHPTDSEAQPQLTKSNRTHRWLKQRLMSHIPMPDIWRFFYMYILRLGFLDGRAGLSFCRFIGMYDYMLALKLRDAKRQSKTPHLAPGPPLSRGVALAIPEGADPRTASGPPPSQAGLNEETRPEASPWSLKEKLGRAVWMLFGKPAFRLSFHNWHRFRAVLLRLFGARLGKRVAIRPSAHIEIPWMLDIDDDATVGDHAILYSLGQIRIGKRSVISQYAHLCAGTHDYRDRSFPLIRASITIGNDVWVGADAFVGPGVQIGDLTVLGARSSTYKSLPAKQVCIGNPAKPTRERVLK